MQCLVHHLYLTVLGMITRGILEHAPQLPIALLASWKIHLLKGKLELDSSVELVLRRSSKFGICRTLVVKHAVNSGVGIKLTICFFYFQCHREHPEDEAQVSKSLGWIFIQKATEERERHNKLVSLHFYQVICKSMPTSLADLTRSSCAAVLEPTGTIYLQLRASILGNQFSLELYWEFDRSKSMPFAWAFAKLV